ncbi:MAG: peptidylprolyl isomerase [Verrucomicrobiales bacterium]
MAPHKKFTVRLILYSVALLYLAGDLFWFNGPVNRRIQAGRPDSEGALEYARSQGVVAKVFGHPILRSQVEREAKMKLWLEGRRMEDLSAEDRREIRLVALNELIDHQLLRVKVQYNAQEFPVSEEEVDEAVLRMASRFASREEMKRELEAEGIDSEKELRFRLAARLQQVKYLESKLAEHLEVREDEARAWYEERIEHFSIPKRVRVRQVFLATLERDPKEVESKLSAAFDELNSGKADFADLARELSEDVRSKHRGGDLGWMSESRLPDDFRKAVFSLKVGEPSLVRTKIGWHLLEVTDRRPARERRFEEAKEDVFAALESAKRMDMVTSYRQALRGSEEATSVKVFPEMMSGE